MSSRGVQNLVPGGSKIVSGGGSIESKFPVEMPLNGGLALISISDPPEAHFRTPPGD